MHSFTLTNGAHEVVEAWSRGSRSGNVSWAITLYDETRERDREHYLEVNNLEIEISHLKQNIVGLQALLTEAVSDEENL